MDIETTVVASLAFKVMMEDGVVVDQSIADAPLDSLHGHNNLITGLEQELEGNVAADRSSVTVAPEDAYGEHNVALILRASADVFLGVDLMEVG
ncbi:FKBP-type peptidyl-prolyl cis-trans isomerase, partial [Vibrio parahaemolyticus]|uniref:FKBP-type peptidyl-prolyl cis-trans isomerase n=1 Tax=Vibrio parahaemolyticus TaxID=670 RepID=UPI0005C1A09B